MTSIDNTPLTKSILLPLREKWSEPDREEMTTWDFDGFPIVPDHWMSYDFEMKEGLSTFDCTSFDELVVLLAEKLGRKPTVIDLMGGAYFLTQPENTDSLVGIRVHPKDEEFLEVSKEYPEAERLWHERVIAAPNRRVIAADVLTNEGWKIIESSQLPPADLLVCRPVGPFDVTRAMVRRYHNPDHYAGLYISLFKRMIKLVNRKSGVIFTEIPDIYSNEQAKVFFESVDSLENSKTKLFTVSQEDYQWGGAKRRYAVMHYV